MLNGRPTCSKAWREIGNVDQYWTNKYDLESPRALTCRHVPCQKSCLDGSAWRICCEKQELDQFCSLALLPVRM